VTVRPAKVSDVMAILDLIEEAKPRTIYKDEEIDRDYTRQFFTRAMHFNGHSNHQATMFLVSERDGKVEGYFFGFLDRLYLVGKRLAATDVHFFMSPRADERDALKIVNDFIAWAEANPKVAEIRFGESNAFGEPDPRFAALLERKGFARGATVFTKRIAT
jgi:hypothetical protein